MHSLAVLFPNRQRRVIAFDISVLKAAVPLSRQNFRYLSVVYTTLTTCFHLEFVSEFH